MKMVISLEAKEVWFGFWLIFMVFFQGRSPRSDSIQCLNLPRIDSIQYRIQYCLPKIKSFFPWQIQLKSIQNFEIGSFPLKKKIHSVRKHKYRSGLHHHPHHHIRKVQV